MKVFAKVTSGVVAELVPDLVMLDGAPVALADRYHPSYVASLIECGGDVQVGWLWNGLAFSPPQKPEETTVGTLSVNRRQAHLALLDAGLLESAETLIAQIADPIERRRAEIEWKAPTYERNSAFLQLLADQLGLTSEQLDALFVQAGQL